MLKNIWKLYWNRFWFALPLVYLSCPANQKSKVGFSHLCASDRCLLTVFNLTHGGSDTHLRASLTGMAGGGASGGGQGCYAWGGSGRELLSGIPAPRPRPSRCGLIAFCLIAVFAVHATGRAADTRLCSYSSDALHTIAHFICTSTWESPLRRKRRPDSSPWVKDAALRGQAWMWTASPALRHDDMLPLCSLEALLPVWCGFCL